MTVNKLDLPSKENAVQEKINEIIDNLSNKATLDENNTFTGDNEFTGWRFAALDPNGAGLEISSDIYLSTPYNKIYIESQDNNYDNSGGELWLSADNLVNVTSASFTYNNSQVATVADIGNGTITINQGGSPKGTFTVNQSGNTTIDLDAGGSTPTNMVTTDTAQNITGVKTFVGQKMIGFKQSTSSNKLGFTLYNNNNVEKGYLEFNPSNTVDSVPLMTLGNYATAAAGLTHVGFRKYSSISGASGAYNLLAPLISDAKTPFNLTTTYTNFYLPLGFTNGTNTVLTAKSGLVDISTLLPTVPTVGNGTITLTQGGVTKGTFTVNQSGNSTIDLDSGGGGTIDQTFDGTSTNAQSGVAINGKLQSYQPLLTAGDNITLQSGGSTWTNAIQISNLSSQTWWACCYDGTKFIAISIYGYVSTSVDGQTWTLAEQDSNLGQYNWWTYVTYGNGTLVAIGYEGYVSTSTDGGITWSEPSQDLGNRYWNGIAYDGTKFVVVGEQGYVSTSTDGINWSEPEYKSELGQINWDSLAYGSGRLVALSASGYRSTSTDGGETWSSPQSIGRSNWYDILYDGNNFVALSNDGYIAKSADGINWTTPEYISELGNHAWTTLGYNGNKLIVLGDYGYYSEALTSTVISAESEIFVAEYDVTSYSDVLTAYNNGKIIYCSVNNAIYNLSNYYNNTFEFKAIVYSGYEAFKLFSLNSNGWSNVNGYEIADTDLRNLSATGKTVLDGQWVSLNQVIYSSQSLTSSTNTDLLKTVNVPNDGLIYEVAFKAQVTTGSSSGNNITLNIKGNVLTDVYYVCSCQTRSNSSVQASGFVSIPLKYASNNLATLRSSSYSGTATLVAIAYRRIGSNT